MVLPFFECMGVLCILFGMLEGRNQRSMTMRYPRDYLGMLIATRRVVDELAVIRVGTTSK